MASYTALDGNTHSHSRQRAALHHHLVDNVDRGDDDADHSDHMTAGSSSTHSTFSLHKNLPSGLSEPLTGGGATDDDALSGDPFYVFREDLYRKLELMDEALAEYLRIVHQTVSFLFIFVAIRVMESYRAAVEPIILRKCL